MLCTLCAVYSIKAALACEIVILISVENTNTLPYRTSQLVGGIVNELE